MNNYSLSNVSFHDSNNFTATNTTSLDPSEVFSTGELVVMRFCYGGFGLIGSIENIAVIASIITSDRLLDVPSNWFVLSLAIADAVVSFLAFPRLFPASTFALVVVGACLNFSLTASAGNLLVLTCNRFLSVYNSLKYPSYMTLQRAKLFVIAPWIAAILLSVVTALSVVTDQLQKLQYAVVVYYTVITMLTIALNGYMLNKARKARKETKKQHDSVTTGQQKTLREEYRLFVRLIVVTATFFASCIPNMIVLYSYPTKDDRQTPSFQRKATWIYVIVLLNSVIDPLVYFITGSEFKRSLAKFQRYINTRVSP